jgi:anti-sigma regulatory factor (Ser/Thr protein kinase)
MPNDQLRSAPVSLRLPFDVSSAGVVRTRLEEWLTELGFDRSSVDDARLVATELVGNAVRHASPVQPDGMLVRWSVGGDRLSLSVSDGGSASVPVQRQASPESTEGRGLHIVDALAERWWVEREKGRSTVHAWLSLAGMHPRRHPMTPC